MGVRGLTTLVENHSKKLLQDFSLHDTKLVIDGFGLLWYLLSQTHGADLMCHGGEYELLRSKITYFFQNLLKCNCRPYVVFDGSFDLDDKKHETILNRFKEKIRLAKEVLRGGDGLLMPPLSMLLMKQVLMELGVGFAVSQFEADKEIAVLANHWQCPVLGKDSDFYVMDIIGGYLPLTLFRWKVLNKSKGKGGQCSISGQIYRVATFCNFYQVKVEFLPLFATLAGNDYVDSASVNAFLASEVYGKFDRSGSKRQSQLKHLLSWLSNQTSSAEAVREMWRQVRDRDSMEGPFTASLEMYKTRNESTCLHAFFEGRGLSPDFKSKSQLCSIIGTPVWVAGAHQAGVIDNMLINIMSKRYCFSSVQVENPKQPSAWMPSKFLFSVLTGIALADKLNGIPPKGKENCTVYLRNGDGFQRLKVPALVTLNGYGRLPKLSEIPSLSETDRQKLLHHVLAPSLVKSLDLVSFPVDFQLALLVTLHWINSKESQINELHVTALLVGWVYLYTQRHQKRHRGQSRRLSTASAHPTDADSSEQLRTEAKAIESSMSYHQGRLRTRKPDPVISHGFAQWQHCLIYAIYLNQLLQCPLPSCPDVSIIFNGLIMHSLYTALRDASGQETLQQWAANRFFRDVPLACQLFVSLHSFVSNSRQGRQAKSVPKKTTSAGKRPPNKSSRPKTQSTPQQRGRDRQRPRREDRLSEDSDSDSEWRASNRFAMLR